MKKVMFGIVVMFVLLAFTITPVAAAGKSAVQHVNFVEKDPTDWSIVEDGAFGKIMYKPNMFVFNGHGLDEGIEYSLIVYNESTYAKIVVGADVADGFGNVHIMGGSLPLVPYTYTSGEYDGQTGTKVWLVPTTDVGGWSNMGDWLYETSLII